MRCITREEITRAMRDAGLDRGQTVYIQADLRMPGMLREARTKDAFCAAYLDCIRDILGPEGTVVVPTYTTQVARFDIDFVWETTPSLMGIFSEHVRTHPESLRSLHPLNSVAALGAHSRLICADNGTNDYGFDSPFHRMLQSRAKILTIGLESGYAVGIAHHLEAACCLPYVYNKLLKWAPVVKGIRDRRLYTATVRHLELEVRYDLTRWVRHMRALGQVQSAPLGQAFVHMADYEQTFLEGAAMLRDDPFYFLAQPPQFSYGVVPFDGPTCGRDGLSQEDQAKQLEHMNWSGFYLADKGYAGGD
jgi:aminoglycoside N3'-acetyltransferase